MKIKVIIFSMVVLIIIFTFSSCGILSQIVTTTKTTSTSNNESENTTSKEEESIETEAITDQIRVSNPLSNQIIQSPLIIEGEALGTWFFEGVFPIMLMDSNGNAGASTFCPSLKVMDDERFCSVQSSN